jgi:hypothetical protein
LVGTVELQQLNGLFGEEVGIILAFRDDRVAQKVAAFFDAFNFRGLTFLDSCIRGHDHGG